MLAASCCRLTGVRLRNLGQACTVWLMVDIMLLALCSLALVCIFRSDRSAADRRMHVASFSMPGITCWQGGAELVGAADVDVASTAAIINKAIAILICCTKIAEMRVALKLTSWFA